MIRIALDTNYAIGLDDAELACLTGQGYRISIPVAVLGELLASSWDLKKPGTLFGPLYRLKKYVDPERPILPHGEALINAILNADEQGRLLIEQGALALWRDLSAERVDDGVWARLGELALQDVKAFAAEASLRLLAERVAWEEAEADDPKLSLLNDVQAARRLRELSPGLDNEIASQRLDAFFAVTKLAIVENARRTQAASENDVEDWGHLVHIGQPAVVLTFDGRFRNAVDRSGSPQAPWVLTFSELLTDGPPTGDPWGENADEVSRKFQRRSDSEIDALEKVVRPKLMSKR